MRRPFIVGVVILSTLPALAAHRATVNQLEQTLPSAAAKHRADTDLARQISDLQLTERLTPETRQRLVSTFSLQPHAALALELLADESSVFDPPPNEIPADAPPDSGDQKRIVEAARAYVLQTLPRLPNFFATRATLRFDDTPQVMHTGEWPIRAGFHLVGNNSRTVTVRDGREVTDSPQQVSDKPDQITGLSSFGEFGPILARTLTDLSRGKIQFSHWEKSSLGMAAVFRYSVPKRESHYQVHFCCLVEREFQGRESFRNRNMPRYHTGNTNPVETNGLEAYDATPAYRGTLAIEPSSGAVVRMTLDAELDPDNAISRASTVVEYGRVVIGDQAFVCPVRSLAISSQQGPPPAETNAERTPILSVNETTFTEYHRLGSSARMLADGAPAEGVPLPKMTLPAPAPDPETATSADPAAGPSSSAASKEHLNSAFDRDEDSSEIAVSAAMAPAQTGVALKVNIAAANLGIHQEAGRWIGKLEIFLVQRGARGFRTRVESLTVNLRLKPDTWQKMLSEGIPFQRTLDMEPGMDSMRILVLDEDTGRLGSVTIPSSRFERTREAAVAVRQAEKP